MVLAAATLGVTSVAVVVGVLAVFGWKEAKHMISEKAHEMSVIAAKNEAKRFLDSDEFKVDVRSVLDDIDARRSKLKLNENVASGKAQEDEEAVEG